MVYTPGHQVITDTHTEGSFGRNGAHPHPDVDDIFPHLPPRTDMEIQQQLYMPSYLTAIDVHIRSQGRIAAVRCEEQMNHDTSVRQGTVAPDILVALDVDGNIIQQRNGYSILEIGKPPDFVMEIAQKNFQRQALQGRVADYEAFGVQECWFFDTTGGEKVPDGLRGWRLVGNRYQDILIQADGAGNRWGYSAILQLAVCWEHGQLRFYDGETGEYLLTHAEDIQRANTAEQQVQAESQRANTAEQQVQAESQRADTAEQRAQAESQRADTAEQRAQAESQRADTSEQRADTAEQENAKMRERLAELGVTLD